MKLISEADKGQIVNLNEATSRGCDTLEVSQAQTGEVASAKKGNIIPTNVQNLQRLAGGHSGVKAKLLQSNCNS